MEETCIFSKKSPLMRRVQKWPPFALKPSGTREKRD